MNEDKRLPGGMERVHVQLEAPLKGSVTVMAREEPISWGAASKLIDQAEKQMNEVEEMETLSEGMEREVDIGDLTGVEVKKRGHDLLAQAEAHMAEAEALRGSWDELTPEAKMQCWELEDSAMLQVKYAKKLLGYWSVNHPEATN